MSQIPSQTRINIWRVGKDCLIQRIAIGGSVGFDKGVCVEQLDLLILFHLTKQRCRVARILGFCHQRELEPAHSALDSIFPDGVLHIKQIGKNLYLNGAPITVCQLALECRPRFLEHCGVWFSVILHILDQMPNLLHLPLKLAPLAAVLL